MKKLMIGIAFGALAVSPALADAYQRTTAAPETNRQAIQGNPAFRAYAYAPPAGVNPSLLGPYPVYADGKYQGSDPDPFIRLMLERDPPQRSFE